MLKNKKGFSLIELLGVLLILAVLFAIIIPRFITFDSNANQQKVNYETKATERYEVIKQTGMETGECPEGQEDCNKNDGGENE